jgi:hypothetical protein
MSFLKLEKHAGIATENLGSFLVTNIKGGNGGNRFRDQAAALLSIKGSIGRKQTVRRAEVRMPTCCRCSVPVQGGVRIKHLEIVGRREFQVFGTWITIRLTFGCSSNKPE